MFQPSQVDVRRFFCSVYAKGKQEQTLEPMERLAQLVIVPVVQAQFNVVTEFPASVRGEGGYGSTGKA